MAEGQKSLEEPEPSTIDLVVRRIADKFSYNGREMTVYGRIQISKWSSKFSLEEIFSAIDTCAAQLPASSSAEPDDLSLGRAFDSIPRVCLAQRAEAAKPHMSHVYYIRALLRKQLNYVDESTLVPDLDYAFHIAGVDPEYIKQVARQARSWTQFNHELWDTISESEAQNRHTPQ